MPRYIDAKYLENQVKDALGKINPYLMGQMLRWIRNQPTIDAVEVVRCRECKHYDTADFDGNILCGCTLHSAMLDITPDSFCSYGKRKGCAE